MFKGLSYKKKLQFLIGGGALVALLFYNGVLSKTLALRKEALALESRLVLTKGLPEKVSRLKRQLGQMESLMGTNMQGRVKMQDVLLGIVTNYCQDTKIILREFPETIRVDEKEMHMETDVFTVEGEFSKLLNLAYQLEQRSKAGKLCSIRFFSKRDPRTNSLALQATMYMQTINKNNHEI